MRTWLARLLYFCGLLFPWIRYVTCVLQGGIETEEGTSVSLGGSATLKCVLQIPGDVLQVTWQKRTDVGQENVATYSTRQGAIVQTGYRDRLNITLLGLNQTAITFPRVTLADEGCYQCLFNTFPSGSSLASTCLHIAGEVATEKSIKADIGTSVTLKCFLRKDYDVLQITWQKNASTEMANLATYTTKTGVNVNKLYRDRLNITLLSLKETAITIRKTSIGDEGCYRCIFNTFPSGSISNTTCLFLFGDLWLSESYVRSMDTLNATCSVTSWPAPVVSWHGLEEVLQNGKTKAENANGTLSVSSWVVLNISRSQPKPTIECRAQNGRKRTVRKIEVNGGQTFHVTTIVQLIAVTLWLAATC